MLQEIEKIIFDSITNLNEILTDKININNKSQSIIYGPKGVIDSISLVSLIVDIEYKIEDKFNKTLTLASEKSISQKNSPFLTVSSLSQYIKNLLCEQNNGK